MGEADRSGPPLRIRAGRAGTAARIPTERCAASLMAWPSVPLSFAPETARFLQPAGRQPNQLAACRSRPRRGFRRQFALTVAAPRAPIPARSTSRSSYPAYAKPAGQSRFLALQADCKRFQDWATPTPFFGQGVATARRTSRSDLLAKGRQTEEPVPVAGRVLLRRRHDRRTPVSLLRGCRVGLMGAGARSLRLARRNPERRSSTGRTPNGVPMARHRQSRRCSSHLGTALPPLNSKCHCPCKRVTVNVPVMSASTVQRPADGQAGAGGARPLRSGVWERTRGTSHGLRRWRPASRCRATAAATPSPRWRCAPPCIDEASGSGCRHGLNRIWHAPPI